MTAPLVRLDPDDDVLEILRGMVEATCTRLGRTDLLDRLAEPSVVVGVRVDAKDQIHVTIDGELAMVATREDYARCAGIRAATRSLPRPSAN